MFKKTKKEVAPNGKVEKLSNNELKNVIGGDGGTPTPAPTPDGTIRQKSHSNTSLTDGDGSGD